MGRPQHVSDQSQRRLRVLIDEQGPTMRRYALSLTAGDHATAEDLVQEALIRAWRSIRTVPADEPGSRRWLFTVLRRLFIDDRRRQQRRPVQVSEVDLTAAATEPDTAVLVLARQSLREAAGRLSGVQREVLFQVFFEDRAVTEVAHRLGIPEGTVRSRLHYALRTLRQAVFEK
ncbi:sigma-70 family RNA polymerase sigma factor [Actinoplanes derwentensis]|uniref:RNA polymerase, sigma-24 subunit, RpoE n=1 Tax=Actinoplanes derwentensis TaxID=113562 RepID=A0A1H1VJ19_9ACTN|nr:sigma-70 family RNA polymerase sigma factor [Actinoplanes derwentensis]GID83691.1 RNA polymerase sigma factor SigL [Actinoplanes derwentensis]SDS84341.1 RNA polymerase, sigma-24 subunit, RpoE [Actinoplanes derwentensis]